jgi:hypothetical protein
MKPCLLTKPPAILLSAFSGSASGGWYGGGESSMPVLRVATLVWLVKTLPCDRLYSILPPPLFVCFFFSLDNQTKSQKTSVENKKIPKSRVNGGILAFRFVPWQEQCFVSMLGWNSFKWC